LTHSTAPSAAFEGRVKKRGSELALSEVEGLTNFPAFDMVAILHSSEETDAIAGESNDWSMT
jgi:hypothetical protein